MTTTVQFYHLLSTSAVRAVPKLMEKALASGSRVLMLLADEPAQKAMSDALWTHDPAGFLPHGTPRDAHADQQPILLALRDEENLNHAEILCVLNGALPAQPERFSKLLDVFDGADETAVAAARQRWQHYKSLGFTLNYVKQQPGGGWKIEMTHTGSSAA